MVRLFLQLQQLLQCFFLLTVIIVVDHGSLLTAAGFRQSLEVFLQFYRRNVSQEILIGDSFDNIFVKKDFLAANGDVFSRNLLTSVHFWMSDLVCPLLDWYLSIFPVCLYDGCSDWPIITSALCNCAFQATLIAIVSTIAIGFASINHLRMMVKQLPFSHLSKNAYIIHQDHSQNITA